VYKNREKNQCKANAYLVVRCPYPVQAHLDTLDLYTPAPFFDTKKVHSIMNGLLKYIGILLIA